MRLLSRVNPIRTSTSLFELWVRCNTFPILQAVYPYFCNAIKVHDRHTKRLGLLPKLWRDMMLLTISLWLPFSVLIAKTIPDCISESSP